MKITTFEKGVSIRLRCGIFEHSIDKIVNENGVNKRLDNFITVGHSEKLRDEIIALLNQDIHNAIHTIAPWLSASLSDPDAESCKEYIDAVNAILKLDQELNA